MGINMSSHDRSVCLLKNEKIICAVSEERLDRRKHSDGRFYVAPVTSFEYQIILPMRSITYCLEEAGIGIDVLDLIVVGRSMVSAKECALRNLPIKDKCKIVEMPQPGHHFAHAYSVYFCSPFKKSAILVVDEQGSWTSPLSFEKHSLYYAKGTKISLLKRFEGTTKSSSLGIFYNYFCDILDLGEGDLPASGTLMALAALGKENPSWRKILKCKRNGEVGFSYRDIQIFCEKAGVKYEIHKKGEDRRFETGQGYFTFERIIDPKLIQDLAYFAQKELERGILHLVRYLYELCPVENLCYAGGVALNCVANSMISQKGPFKNIFIQPAATDDGTAIGLAYYGLYNIHKSSKRFFLRTAFLGKYYDKKDYQAALGSRPFKLLLKPRRYHQLIRRTAYLLAQGKVMGWFQGRSEFGPRALGNRSILAHPGIRGMKNYINQKIKYRHNFRPLAPSIMQEYCKDFFEPSFHSPFMLFTAKVKNDKIPIVSEIVHADGSSRVHTVNKKENPLFYNLLLEFKKITGLPLLINTSFNCKSEPMVESPKDALTTFFKSKIDCLVLGNYLLEKEKLNSEKLRRISEAFKIESVNLNAVAETLKNKGFLREAIQSYKKELNMSYSKDEFRIYFNLGECYFKLKEYKKAIFTFSRCLQKNTLDSAGRLYYLLGVSYMLDKQFKKAVSYLESAKEIFGNEHYINLHLLKCHRALGRREEVIRIVENGLKSKTFLHRSFS